MGILLPPPQYDHPPTIPVIEQVMPWNELQKSPCRATFDREGYSQASGRGGGGCAFIKDGKCYVYRLDMPDIERHELAHCNGWPGNHPGGYYEFNK